MTEDPRPGTPREPQAGPQEPQSGTTRPIPWSGTAHPVPGNTAQYAVSPPYDPATGQTSVMPPYPYGYGAAPGGPGGPGPADPGYPLAGPQPYQSPPKRGRAGLLAGALALALVSGGVGGAVGTLATRDGHSSAGVSTNALDVPPPKGGGVTNAPSGTIPAVAQKVLPSVVMIRVSSNKAEGEGSGVILSSDGMILTNNHVASGAGANAKMDVQFSDGTSAAATVVGVDPVSDLAVIKVSGKSGLTPIELGTSKDLQVGQSVVAIGSPLGLAGTVTTGIVSALNRPVSTSGESGGQGTVISAVQTDAPINPGNSGGALVDLSGKLIGINTAIATLGAGGVDSGGAQSGSIGLGFAIPVDQARRVADQLSRTGHATYAQVGMSVRAIDDTNGARILDITPDGPAAKAGIPGGVIVTKVDDQIIDSGNALIAAVRSHQPGDKVKVTYTDGNGQNPKTVDVVLGAAPADGGGR
ncbi:S1C family serine protease [Nocardia sp. alder85J]|uniref:S1C family serine protease n=1 Tax=Nocardia sp. alder85J TaxID=2862949 RepID=UPI001CD68B31|nr:trypsin-like peptidase domain-containing protein [Nocardia sp. alder85J]MCX4097082.1 trypsin-like peptidase domain-containing protein [Nocardia sp. alder85J]